jgi:hemolysin
LLTNGANQVSQVVTPPNYLTKPEEGGIMVVGAGTEPKSGAYNTDINPKVGGVHFGDATNFKGIPDNFFSLVIIDNPFKFNPYNSEILRVLQKGGELKVTGVESNRYFNSIIEDIDKKIIKVPEGYELIEVKEILISERKQGFQSSGRPIGKKTDTEIRLRKK